MSPLGLNILLFAGLLWVKHNTRHLDGDAAHFLFMDDRSWTASTLPKLLGIKTAWQRWSAIMGLLENAGKTQLTALRPKDLEELRKAADPREVKQNLVMLGTVTVTRMQRRTAAEEAQRLEKAASTAARATFLPLSRKAKYETIGATATAQASYGWIGRKPPEAECKRLDLAAWKACGEPYDAGMHHKRLLLSLPLETEIGIRQVMRMLHASGRWRLVQAAPTASEKCAFEC